MSSQAHTLGSLRNVSHLPQPWWARGSYIITERDKDIVIRRCFSTNLCCFCSVTKRCLTLCSPMDQHARLPCPSLSPGACSNSRPLTWWCYPTISSSVPPASPPPSIFPSITFFSNESALCLRWPKYWSFSFSPSSEYSRLISFKIDWFGLLAVQGTESYPTPQFESFSSSVFSLLHGPAHIHTWQLEKS